MKKHLLLILSILLTITLPLAATSYPSLDREYEVENGDEVIIDQDRLQSFIQEWQQDSLISFSEAEKKLRIILKERNPDLEQLESLYRIQQEQINFQQRDQDFKFGLSSQPLYSLSRSLNQSTTGGYDLSNKFSVGATISKKLKTGATATLSATQSSVLEKNSTTGSLWTWTHSPSANITFNQPLGLGEGLIDPNYSNKQLEKLQISNENAKLSIDQLIEALVSQGNSQLSTLQNLKERRFLLGEQLLIENSSIKEAKKDLEDGRISRNDLEARVLNINQIRYSLTEIERQIESIEDSLNTLWKGDNYPKLLIVDSALFEMLPTIIFDKEKLITILLANDFSYAKAMRNLHSAEIDTHLKSTIDAPQLNLSLQFYPYYTPNSGTNFFTSFTDLFTDSEPIFSLSIGFSATDLSRPSTTLSTALAAESVLQAKIEVEKERDALELKVDEIQRNIKGLLLNLSLAQVEFEQRTNDVEVEKIRFEIGLANEKSIKAKEISRYEAAFTILQILREIELIALDLKSSGIGL